MQQAWFLCEAEQVVFREEFEKLVQGQVIVGTIERQHEELLAQPVVHVDCSGSWVPRDALQNQNRLWHLDPTRGDSFSDAEKCLNQSIHVGLGIAKSQFVDAEQSVGCYGSSAEFHVFSPFEVICSIAGNGNRCESVLNGRSLLAPCGPIRLTAFFISPPNHFQAFDKLSGNFYICGNMKAAQKTNPADVARYADMLSAMGTEPRLRIVRLLLSAHPDGMFVGEIGEELGIANSTLSHHLDKLKNEDLVQVQREGTFLRYTANTQALQELLGFLYAECCTRNKAVEPQQILCCK